MAAGTREDEPKQGALARAARTSHQIQELRAATAKGGARQRGAQGVVDDAFERGEQLGWQIFIAQLGAESGVCCARIGRLGHCKHAMRHPVRQSDVAAGGVAGVEIARFRPVVNHCWRCCESVRKRLGRDMPLRLALDAIVAHGCCCVDLRRRCPLASDR